jgi:hypothetical protein
LAAAGTVIFTGEIHAGVKGALYGTGFRKCEQDTEKIPHH